MGKTGGWGGPWVELERPKPPPVADEYAYWGNPPPKLSPRCVYWMRQIQRGWRPNRRIQIMGWSSSTEWFGVWTWEYLNVIYPKLRELEAES